jgi:hypothetical protein
VEGDIMLHIPYIVALHQKDTSVQSLAKDSHLKDQLEEVVMSWERHVTTVTDSYLTKVQRIERTGLRKYCTLLGCLCMCVYVCVYVCTYVPVYLPSIYVRMHANASNDSHAVPPRPMDRRRSCQCTKTSVYSDAFVHLQWDFAWSIWQFISWRYTEESGFITWCWVLSDHKIRCCLTASLEVPSALEACRKSNTSLIKYCNRCSTDAVLYRSIKFCDTLWGLFSKFLQ